MAFIAMLIVIILIGGLILFITTAVAALSAQQKLKILEKNYQDIARRLKEVERRQTGAIPLIPKSSSVTSGSEEEKKPAASVPRAGIATMAPAAAPPDDALIKLAAAPIPNASTIKPETNTHGSRAERAIATRLAIWAGAVSIALGCIYLVKYSFDSGILSPAVRVCMGAFFGLVLVIGGWVLRHGSPRPAQGIAAAGTVAVYASLLAAADLYHFLPALAAFILLAIWTGAAIVMSLAIGPLIAVLGLLGGLLTPIMIHSHHPHSTGLFLYLLLLQAGLLIVTRKRSWLPLAVITAFGTNIWVWLWLLLSPMHAWDGVVMGIFVLASTISLLFIPGALATGLDTSAPQINNFQAGWMGLAWIGMTFGILNNVLVLSACNFSNTQWMFMTVLAAGSLVLGRLKFSMRVFPWLAAGAVFLMLFIWSIHTGAIQHNFNNGTWHVFQTASPVNKAERGVYVWAGVFGLLFGVGAFLCLWGTMKPEGWAALSISSAAASVLIVLTTDHFQHRGAWAGISMIITGLYILGAFIVHKTARYVKDPQAALGALMIGIMGFPTLAAYLDFKNGELTLVLAAGVPLAAFLWRYTNISILSTILRLLALIVGIRLLLNANIFNYPISDTSILFNWIVACYGGATALFILARRLLRKANISYIDMQLDASTALFLTAGSGLAIRHAFHPHGWNSAAPSLLEFAGYSYAALGLSMIALTQIKHSSLAKRISEILAIIGVLCAVIGGLILANPLYVHHTVSGPWDLAVLIPGYLIPAILAGLMGYMVRRGEKLIPTWTYSGALILLFGFISLTARAAFHPISLNTGSTGNAELYTYSLVWAMLGLTLLILAIMFKGVTLRFASLAIMLVTMVKVFTIDTSHLQNLLRVLSLVGLGVSLILLGYLYQRFVFTGTRESPGTASGR